MLIRLPSWLHDSYKEAFHVRYVLIASSTFCGVLLQWLENARRRVGLSAEADGGIQDAVDAALGVGQARSFPGPGAVCTAALVACERAAVTCPKERKRRQGSRRARLI